MLRLAAVSVALEKRRHWILPQCSEEIQWIVHPVPLALAQKSWLLRSINAIPGIQHLLALNSVE